MGKKMGRKPKPINWDKVDEMLKVGCPGTEIASYFDMHCNNFYSRVVKDKGMPFTEYASRLHDVGNVFIRQAQYDKAVKGRDNTMLIWLGKQRLNQKENITPEVDADTTHQYLEVIKQLSCLQSAKKIEQSNETSEPKSA